MRIRNLFSDCWIEGSRDGNLRVEAALNEKKVKINSNFSIEFAWRQMRLWDLLRRRQHEVFSAEAKVLINCWITFDLWRLLIINGADINFKILGNWIMKVWRKSLKLLNTNLWTFRIDYRKSITKHFREIKENFTWNQDEKRDANWSL